MNHNLLIVDDEMEILSWLQEMFREEFDIETGIYTANSAMEAIRLLAKVRFDVVLTDIRMPGMDGIKLFDHIKENWPQCKVVFLSGYRSFDHLYQLVNHKDVRFILKSEEDAVILNTVREMFDQYERELTEESDRQKTQAYLEGARYWLQRDFMNRLCKGLVSDEELGEMRKLLELPLDAKRKVLVFLLRMESDWTANRVEDTLEQEEFAGLLMEHVPGKLLFYTYMLETGQQLLLVQPPEKADTDWDMVRVISQGALEYAQEKFQKLHEMTVSSVAMPEAVSLHELPQALRLLQRFLTGKIGTARGVFAQLDAKEQEMPENELNVSQSIEVMSGCMEMHRKEDYFRELQSCVRQLITATGKHDAKALEIYYSISVFLLQFINAKGLNEQIAFHIETYKLMRIDLHENWTQAADYLVQISEAIFALLKENENSIADRALQRVLTYIEGHLEEDLSLTQLAEVGGFNASYLSRLFKQEQGETLSDYILHKRIHLAKKLLSGSNEKIQNIAAKAGYLSAHSFTRAFRGEVGITPTEYREINYRSR